jgi:hypothetical protein
MCDQTLLAYSPGPTYWDAAIANRSLMVQDSAAGPSTIAVTVTMWSISSSRSPTVCLPLTGCHSDNRLLHGSALQIVQHLLSKLQCCPHSTYDCAANDAAAAELSFYERPTSSTTHRRRLLYHYLRRLHHHLLPRRRHCRRYRDHLEG